ncbi:MAG: hypothetical protein LBT92_02345 [Rickettsiales bacterium]|jgi:hypothetical protein|nr:hypothetical protein [Rickettsiales bacterium]
MNRKISLAIMLLAAGAATGQNRNTASRRVGPGGNRGKSQNQSAPAAQPSRRGSGTRGAGAARNADDASAAVTPPLPTITEPYVPILPTQAERTEAPADEGADGGLIDQILKDFDNEYEAARGACSSIPGSINSLKIASGISTAASAVGTLAAGTALTVGLVKASMDKDLEVLERAQWLVNHGEEAGEMSAVDLLPIMQKLKELADNDKNFAEMLKEQQKKSKSLGKVRTAGLFIAGGTSAVASVSSFIGASGFDKLMSDMRECTKHVTRIASINNVVNEYLAKAPVMESKYGPLLSGANVRADRLAAGCRPFNIENISSIKSQMIASGVVSAVGTATGIGGGIVSRAANSDKVRDDNSAKGQAKEKNLNLAANILSGVTLGTSAVSVILSGKSIADLNANETAAKGCAGAF